MAHEMPGDFYHTGEYSFSYNGSFWKGWLAAMSGVLIYTFIFTDFSFKGIIIKILINGKESSIKIKDKNPSALYDQIMQNPQDFIKKYTTENCTIIEIRAVE